jgi:hypothetical protein
MRDEELLTGSLRADQSIVLHRQDRRDLAVPGLPPSIWCRLHIGDADEFVWSPGTIVIGEQPRHADPSPALPRGEAEQRPDRDGTDKPLREFLFVDDLADTCLFVLEHYSDEQHVNIGSGQQATLAEFAKLVAEVLGYRGGLAFDPRKLIDSSRLAGRG